MFKIYMVETVIYQVLNRAITSHGNYTHHFSEVCFTPCKNILASAERKFYTTQMLTDKRIMIAYICNEHTLPHQVHVTSKC